VSGRVNSVKKDTPAYKSGLRAGDIIIRVNGHAINDILDYKFYSYDQNLLVEITRDGRKLFARVRKKPGEDSGLDFENPLIDNERSCSNRCIFCFIDQLPRHMRPTLYYKDDDARLSFLQGNYITMTNLTEAEIDRIIRLRISPLNISVHTMNPELRAMMLGNPKGADGVAVIRRLAEAGIVMNCQIVVCPGINDGEELNNTIRELSLLYPAVNSVSVVPVGLTKHRDELYNLKPFDRMSAAVVIDDVEHFGDVFLKEWGSRLFYPADEFYIMADREFPPDIFYEDYAQLENGVGMARLFIEEFMDRLAERPADKHVPFTIVTGLSGAGIVNNLLAEMRRLPRYAKINGQVTAVKNEFFGALVNVSGLVTGGDIIRTLDISPPSGRILLPANMLRHGETVFLDDVSISDITERFGVGIRIVKQDGADLLDAILGD